MSDNRSEDSFDTHCFDEDRELGAIGTSQAQFLDEDLPNLEQIDDTIDISLLPLRQGEQQTEILTIDTLEALQYAVSGPFVWHTSKSLIYEFVARVGP